MLLELGVPVALPLREDEAVAVGLGVGALDSLPLCDGDDVGVRVWLGVTVLELDVVALGLPEADGVADALGVRDVEALRDWLAVAVPEPLGVCVALVDCVAVAVAEDVCDWLGEPVAVDVCVRVAVDEGVLDAEGVCDCVRVDVALRLWVREGVSEGV